MRVGDTLKLFKLNSPEDAEGYAFDATVMLIDRDDGVVAIKELGFQPITCSIQWLAESMAYRAMHDLSESFSV